MCFLPATTPVVIRGEQAGTYLLMPYTGEVPTLDKWENKLIGSSIGQEGKWGVSVNQGDANEGSILTLGRRRVSGTPTRGIYIKGNRKVFINKQ